jgi:hypothetical protein
MSATHAHHILLGLVEQRDLRHLNTLHCLRSLFLRGMARKIVDKTIEMVAQVPPALEIMSRRFLLSHFPTPTSWIKVDICSSRQSPQPGYQRYQLRHHMLRRCRSMAYHDSPMIGAKATFAQPPATDHQSGEADRTRLYPLAKFLASDFMPTLDESPLPDQKYMNECHTSYLSTHHIFKLQYL